MTNRKRRQTPRSVSPKTAPSAECHPGRVAQPPSTSHATRSVNPPQRHKTLTLILGTLVVLWFTFLALAAWTT
ncbi:MAG: hypothetical protein VX034_06980 [Planctomycetota bacterium]|nr:hypothetical protein [Planctomycetota bacterium]MEC8304444.1 hypothetical protein [Planctomycetota bacterium]